MNKTKLFSNFKRFFKSVSFSRVWYFKFSGGQLLITDYCCGNKELSPDFKTYVAQKKYTLWSIKDYSKALSKAGFAFIEAVDNSEECKKILRYFHIKYLSVLFQSADPQSRPEVIITFTSLVRKLHVIFWKFCVEIIIGRQFQLLTILKKQ